MMVLMRLPLADDDDGNAAANNAITNEDPKPANKNELKQNNKMPKQERRIKPSADSPTMVSKSMQHLMSCENNNIKINAQQQA